ncbi:unnamed protein product, partial [Phaeothamnion confervicola]
LHRPRARCGTGRLNVLGQSKWGCSPRRVFAWPGSALYSSSPLHGRVYGKAAHLPPNRCRFATRSWRHHGCDGGSHDYWSPHDVRHLHARDLSSTRDDRMRTDPIVRKHAAEPSVRGLKVFGLGLALMWLLLDQATKWWILEYASALTEPLHVTSFFNVVLGWNRGISFGMLGGHELPPWTLALLSGSIAVALIVWLLRTPDRLIATGL